MLESNLNAVNTDLRSLVKDAQALLHSATALTGEKAEEARNRGMQLLDTALNKAHDAQTKCIVVGKEMAASADHYVKENPWRVVAGVASLTLLIGYILGRK